MRRLALLALVVPVLSACGWSPFSATSRQAPRIVHRCAVPCLSGPVRPGPVRRSTALVSGGGALTDNANDSYVAWGVALVSATELPVAIPLPPGYSTITDLQVHLTTAPGSGASWTLTVDKNGSATALSCSIVGAATACSDSSLVAVANGGTIDLDVTPFSSPARSRFIAWSATLLP